MLNKALLVGRKKAEVIEPAFFVRMSKYDFTMKDSSAEGGELFGEGTIGYDIRDFKKQGGIVSIDGREVDVGEEFCLNRLSNLYIPEKQKIFFLLSFIVPKAVLEQHLSYAASGELEVLGLEEEPLAKLDLSACTLQDNISDGVAVLDFLFSSHGDEDSFPGLKEVVEGIYSAKDNKVMVLIFKNLSLKG